MNASPWLWATRTILLAWLLLAALTLATRTGPADRPCSRPGSMATYGSQILTCTDGTWTP